MRIGAKQLLKLLEARHSSDVFVPECKNGATQSVARGEMVKMDAWAMSRSWSKPHTYGYEIKVSRQDFLQDDKWHRYLDLCSHFSFVAPPGIIEKGELPEEAGLLVCTANCKRLLTKKKAPRRDIQVPEDLFWYVLMCRVVVGQPNGQANRQFWESWLREKELSRALGHRVSRSLSRLVSERIEEVELENKRLSREVEKLDGVREMCERIGYSPWTWHREGELEQKIADQHASVPSDVKKAADKAMKTISELWNTIEAHEQPTAEVG